MTIKKGDTVRIKPEWQDEGDNLLTWHALEDEDGGRVLIQPQGTGMALVPSQVVRVDMLEA